MYLKKRWLLCCLLLVQTLVSAAQSLKGKIVDGQTGKPLAKASVYINTTTIGTTSGDDGSFEIAKYPSRKFELIVSYVGYQTLATVISLPTEEALVLKMMPKSKDLQEVIVRNYEKDGWAKWGAWFLENFLGTSKTASQCSIKNTKDVRFAFSKKENTLYVITMNPLVIANKQLGYTVEYDLEAFYSNFTTHEVYYQGYPRFIEMKGGKARQKKWQQNRKNMYEGSMMHFCRSVFNRNVEANGFQVRKLVKNPNTEKQRVRQLYKERKDSKDSSNYYSNIMRQPDYFNVLYAQPLPLNYFTHAIDSSTVALAFKDFLQVSYIRKKPPEEYYTKNRMPGRDSCLQSELMLKDLSGVHITRSGNFYEPGNLLFSGGFWAWHEKVASMLPLDYEEQ